MNLYYYTTTETLRYILTNGNIYATNMRYMNDAEEYTNGLREIKDLLHRHDSPFQKAAQKILTDERCEEYLRGEVDSFSISFTENRDLLSQWIMYAKESGVSIGLDFSKSKYQFLAYSADSKERDISYSEVVKPRPVYYFTRGAMPQKTYDSCSGRIIKDLERQAEKQEIKDYEESVERLWLGMVPYVKRFDFIAEKEYRLVFDFSHEMEKRPRVDFRNDKNVLKPYLDIECKGGWPVVEIIVGPGFNQDAVFQSLRYFLDNQELNIGIMSSSKWLHMSEEYLFKMGEYEFDDAELEEVRQSWRDIYEKKCKEVSKEDRYQAFWDFLGGLEMNMKYRERLILFRQHNYFSKDGILLSKSHIPYIY